MVQYLHIIYIHLSISFFFSFLKVGFHIAKAGFDFHITEDDLELVIFFLLPGLKMYLPHHFVCMLSKHSTNWLQARLLYNTNKSKSNVNRCYTVLLEEMIGRVHTYSLQICFLP